MKNFKVFFDFDNTITTFDILDDMLVRFSKSGDWGLLEERWKRDEAFRSIVNYAYRRSAFYRGKFDERGIRVDKRYAR